MSISTNTPTVDLSYLERERDFRKIFTKKPCRRCNGSGIAEAFADGKCFPCYGTGKTVDSSKETEFYNKWYLLTDN